MGPDWDGQNLTAPRPPQIFYTVYGEETKTVLLPDKDDRSQGEK